MRWVLLILCVVAVLPSVGCSLNEKLNRAFSGRLGTARETAPLTDRQRAFRSLEEDAPYGDL